MKENLEVVFGLLGGLALFLYGMNSMSDALQKAAGEKMKRILEVLTKNPVMGALAGALVTAVLQSSSGNNRYGYWICQCRTDEPAAGYICYIWCEYRNDDDSTINGIQDQRLYLSDYFYWIYGIVFEQA